MIKYIAFLFLLCVSLCEGSAVAPEDPLMSGWYPWAPYQYLERGKDGVLVLTGLDAELVRALSKEAGQIITYTDQVPWAAHKSDLKTGKRDLATGVTPSSDLAPYVYLSEPYRFESNALYQLKDPTRGPSLRFHSMEQFIGDIKHHHFRLGVVDGFAYVDKSLNDFINNPQNARYIVRSNNEEENLQKLLDGRIDGFLADRLSGATAIWKQGQTKKIKAQDLHMKVPIHLAFSKKHVSFQTVAAYNAALERLKKSGAYDTIYRQYLYPLMMLQALDSDWFFILEIIGTIAFAISGLIVAYKDDATFFGAVIFALLPSTGGGMLRDALVGREPVGLLLSPIYLYIALGTVFAGYMAIQVTKNSISLKTQKMKDRLNICLMVSDAVGLAAFTVVGVMVALLVKISPLWLWGPFLAFLTGAGGGILRDLLRKDAKVEGLHGDIYPEIALLWGGLLSFYFVQVGASITSETMFYTVIATSVGAFITRVGVAYYKIPNLRFR